MNQEEIAREYADRQNIPGFHKWVWELVQKAVIYGMEQSEADIYQKKALSFKMYEIPVIVETVDGELRIKESLEWDYPSHGLTEEAGEVAGKFAKIIRDKGGAISNEDKLAISKELGDCLWMIAEICSVLDLSLSEVMELNIKKLEDRKARNVISGSGDNR